MSIIIGIFVAIIVIGVYIFIYRLNKSIPIPEEAKNLLKECEGCSNKGCGHHPSHN